MTVLAAHPTTVPTASPTALPTALPTAIPTTPPTSVPTVLPTPSPSNTETVTLMGIVESNSPTVSLTTVIRPVVTFVPTAQPVSVRLTPLPSTVSPPTTMIPPRSSSPSHVPFTGIPESEIPSTVVPTAEPDVGYIFNEIPCDIGGVVSIDSIQSVVWSDNSSQKLFQMSSSILRVWDQSAAMSTSVTVLLTGDVSLFSVLLEGSSTATISDWIDTLSFLSGMESESFNDISLSYDGRIAVVRFFNATAADALYELWLQLGRNVKFETRTSHLCPSRITVGNDTAEIVIAGMSVFDCFSNLLDFYNITTLAVDFATIEPKQEKISASQIISIKHADWGLTENSSLRYRTVISLSNHAMNDTSTEWIVVLVGIQEESTIGTVISGNYLYLHSGVYDIETSQWIGPVQSTSYFVSKITTSETDLILSEITKTSGEQPYLNILYDVLTVNSSVSTAAQVLRVIDQLSSINSTNSDADIISVVQMAAEAFLGNTSISAGEVIFDGVYITLFAAGPTSSPRVTSNSDSLVIVTKISKNLFTPKNESETLFDDVFGFATTDNETEVAVPCEISRRLLLPYPCYMFAKTFDQGWSTRIDIPLPRELLQLINVSEIENSDSRCSNPLSTSRRVNVLGKEESSSRETYRIEVKHKTKLGSIGVFVANDVLPSTNFHRLFNSENWNSYTKIDEENIPTLVAVGILYVFFYSMVAVAAWYDQRQDEQLEKHSKNVCKDKDEKIGLKHAKSLRKIETKTERTSVVDNILTEEALLAQQIHTMIESGDTLGASELLYSNPNIENQIQAICQYYQQFYVETLLQKDIVPEQILTMELYNYCFRQACLCDQRDLIMSIVKEFVDATEVMSFIKSYEQSSGCSPVWVLPIQILDQLAVYVTSVGLSWNVVAVPAITEYLESHKESCLFGAVAVVDVAICQGWTEFCSGYEIISGENLIISIFKKSKQELLTHIRSQGINILKEAVDAVKANPQIVNSFLSQLSKKECDEIFEEFGPASLMEVVIESDEILLLIDHFEFIDFNWAACVGQLLNFADPSQTDNLITKLILTLQHQKNWSDLIECCSGSDVLEKIILLGDSSTAISHLNEINVHWPRYLHDLYNSKPELRYRIIHTLRKKDDWVRFKSVSDINGTCLLSELPSCVSHLLKLQVDYYALMMQLVNDDCTAISEVILSLQTKEEFKKLFIELTEERTMTLLFQHGNTLATDRLTEVFPDEWIQMLSQYINNNFIPNDDICISIVKSIKDITEWNILSDSISESNAIRLLSSDIAKDHVRSLRNSQPTREMEVSVGMEDLFKCDIRRKLSRIDKSESNPDRSFTLSRATSIVPLSHQATGEMTWQDNHPTVTDPGRDQLLSKKTSKVFFRCADSDETKQPKPRRSSLRVKLDCDETPVITTMSSVTVPVGESGSALIPIRRASASSDGGEKIPPSPSRTLLSPDAPAKKRGSIITISAVDVDCGKPSPQSKSKRENSNVLPMKGVLSWGGSNTIRIVEDDTDSNSLRSEEVQKDPTTTAQFKSINVAEEYDNTSSEPESPVSVTEKHDFCEVTSENDIIETTETYQEHGNVIEEYQQHQTSEPDSREPPQLSLAINIDLDGPDTAPPSSGGVLSPLAEMLQSRRFPVEDSIDLDDPLDSDCGSIRESGQNVHSLAVSNEAQNYCVGEGLVVSKRCISPLQGGISPLQGGISPLQGGISPLQGGISPLQGGISPLQGGISPLQGGISPLQGGISPLQGGFSPLQGGISPLQGVISPLLATDTSRRAVSPLGRPSHGSLCAQYGVRQRRRSSKDSSAFSLAEIPQTEHARKSSIERLQSESYNQFSSPVTVPSQVEQSQILLPETEEDQVQQFGDFDGDQVWPPDYTEMGPITDGTLPGRINSVVSNGFRTKSYVVALNTDTPDENTEDSKWKQISRAIRTMLSAHIWFCVFCRKAKQSYTRPQRLMVLFSAINTVFFICAMFMGHAEANSGVVKAITTAIVAGVLMMPTTVVLGLLFKRAYRSTGSNQWVRKGPDEFNRFPVIGELTVRVLEARHLPIVDDDVPDCFVVTESEGRSWTTQTIWDDQNPRWDASQCVVYQIHSDSTADELVISVYDDDGGQVQTPDKLSTTLIVPMSEFTRRLVFDDTRAVASIDEWFALQDPLIANGVMSPKSGSRRKSDIPEIRILCEYIRYQSPEFESIEHKTWWEIRKKRIRVASLEGADDAHFSGVPLSLWKRSVQHLPQSLRFMIFIILVLLGVTFLMGFAKWWMVTLGLCIVLCVATFFLQLRRAARLLILSLCLYGCIFLIVMGEVAVGIGLLYLICMLAACLICSAYKPHWQPAVMAIFWSGHIFIVLVLYYNFDILYGLISIGVQSAVSATLWYATVQKWCSHVHVSSYIASTIYVSLWGFHLLMSLYFGTYEETGDISDAERWLSPFIFTVSGWLVVVRSYQLRKGGLIPQHLPRWIIHFAYLLAICIQLGSATMFLGEALKWEQETRNNFMLSTVIAFTQDIFINEPAKLLILTYAAPMMKALSKSAIGRTFTLLMKEMGLLQAMNGCLGK